MPELLYLYGVVPADAPEPGPALEGVDGRPVRLVRMDGFAAAVSAVEEREYADDALDARLSDLSWVGERGLAHERVLDWFMERGPVVPSSLFSLHLGEERVRERFAAETGRLTDLLGRLAGRNEWGIKLWRDEEGMAGQIDRLSPTLRALAAEMEAAAPGRRFLLQRRLDAARVEELRAVSRRVAHQSYSMLQEAAERATTVPVPQAAGEGGRTLLLHAAFLVPDGGFPRFQERVTQVAHEFGGVGFEVEFTGPWPPYHFVGPDD